MKIFIILVFVPQNIGLYSSLYHNFTKFLPKFHPILISSILESNFEVIFQGVSSGNILQGVSSEDRPDALQTAVESAEVDKMETLLLPLPASSDSRSIVAFESPRNGAGPFEDQVRNRIRVINDPLG